MIRADTPPVDSRDTNALVTEFENRRQGYLPAWNPPPKSAGAAMGPILARLLGAILQRLNQAPGKDKLAFLDLLGLRLVPAQPARAPIVFALAQNASDILPPGTQVAAPPPPGSSQQIVFSTEQDAAVAAAKLTEIVSLWPGRDQYINHSAALAAGQPFTLFQNLQLQPTDHILYLGHSKDLGIRRHSAPASHIRSRAGQLITAGHHLGILGRQSMAGIHLDQPSCLDPQQTGYDGTNGLSDAGNVLILMSRARKQL